MFGPKIFWVQKFWVKLEKFNLLIRLMNTLSVLSGGWIRVKSFYRFFRRQKLFTHAGISILSKVIESKKKWSFMTENLISDFLNPSQDFPFF